MGIGPTAGESSDEASRDGGCTRVTGANGRRSWQARLFAAWVRILVRREDWGSESALARRARRILGAPRAYGWLRTRGVRVRKARGPIRGEWLHPPADTGGVILYIHGGGFVSCSAVTHRPITAALARLTGMRVFALDYPLAPEQRYPAAPDAVLAAYRFLLDTGADPARLAVVGDSAGGNLAVGLLVRARDGAVALPACAAALSPWLDLGGGSPSVQENDGRCAMFRPQNMADFAHTYLDAVGPDDPNVSPLHGSLGGLPPLLLQAAEEELLRDDAVRAHARIRADGGISELQLFSGVFHGWHMLDGLVPEARVALARVAAFLHHYETPPVVVAQPHPPRPAAPRRGAGTGAERADSR